MPTASVLLDLLEGKAPTLSEEDKSWSAEEEGNAKLQKVLRKRAQYLDDPNEPYGYRKSKKDLIGHLLTWEFPEKEDDKRKGPKSAEQIQKMQAGRKNKTVKESMQEYLENI